MPSAAAGRSGNADGSVEEMQSGVGQGPCVRRRSGYGSRARAHRRLTDDRFAFYRSAVILPRGHRGAAIVACAPAVSVLPSSLPLSGISLQCRG
jgi:hypothetical protein